MASLHIATELIENSYLIVIISNQAGIALKSNPKAPSAHKARLSTFKGKATSVLSQLDIPIGMYAATEKDIYRKPRTGMWQELLDDNDLSDPSSIDKENCFFVGDAGGRLHGGGFSKDFSSSDRYYICECCVIFMLIDTGILHTTLESSFSHLKSTF